MLPIPAIDIQSGKCVRLQKGDLSSTKIYFEKPIDAAAHWIKKGTKRLHLVDLDGAKSGKPENLKYCLLYTSPSPRDIMRSRMPCSA